MYDKHLLSAKIWSKVCIIHRNRILTLFAEGVSGYRRSMTVHFACYVSCIGIYFNYIHYIHVHIHISINFFFYLSLRYNILWDGIECSKIFFNSYRWVVVIYELSFFDISRRWVLLSIRLLSMSCRIWRVVFPRGVRYRLQLLCQKYLILNLISMH